MRIIKSSKHLSISSTLTSSVWQHSSKVWTQWLLCRSTKHTSTVPWPSGGYMGVLMAWTSSLFSVEAGSRTIDLIRPHSCVGSGLEREAPLEIMKHKAVCRHKHLYWYPLELWHSQTSWSRFLVATSGSLACSYMQLGLSPEDSTL
jgi:hypothetical protein